MFFRFSSNGGGEGKEDLYTDTIRQVIDHVLVQHFQTFAYKCDGCAHTFNTKVTLKTLNVYVNYRELLQVLLLRRGQMCVCVFLYILYTGAVALIRDFQGSPFV